MKRQLGVCLIGMLMFSVTSIYAGEVSIQNNQLTIPMGEKAFSIQLNIDEDERYAGAEFGIDLTQGLEIKSINYRIDQDYMNVGPVQNSSGTYYFGYFDGENKFSGDYTIILDLEKVDETIKEASISLKALNITKLDSNQNVISNKKKLNQQVQVVFEAEQVAIQEEPVVPQEIPNDPSKQKGTEIKPTEKEQPQIEKNESTEVEEMPNVKIEEPQKEATQPIEIEPIAKPAPVIEKEIVEVNTPLPYGKLTLGGIVIAGLAFFIGRFTKQGRIAEKVHLTKEEKHDQQL